MKWQRLLVVALALVCWNVLAGWMEIDFRENRSETNNWTMAGTTVSQKRGLKFAGPGSFLKSPMYGGAITSITVVTFCSSTRIDYPFIVSVGTAENSFRDCDPRIEYALNQYVTNSFSFGEASAIHGMQIRLNASGEVKGYYYVTSVAVRWTGGPLEPPTNVQVENVETNAFLLRWTPPDDAESCRPLVWTNRVVGASPGEVVWCESFSNAPAKTGSIPALPSGSLEGYADAPDDSRQWELDHVYPSVEAGALRIGGTETNGWIRTPQLPGGTAFTLRLRARRQNSKDGVDMPVRRNSSGCITELGVVSLTDEFQDHLLSVPELREGDHLEIHSTTNKRSTRVILDSIELLHGYETGWFEPEYLVNEDVVVEGSFQVENLPMGEYFFAVEAVRGDEHARSSTGRVDLAIGLLPVVPLPVRFSGMGELEWRESFDGLASLFLGTDNQCTWVNGVTFPPWQAWCDGDAATEITRNQGGVANGGLYAYWATNEVVSSYALGMNVESSANEFVCGVAFTNDLRTVFAGFSLTYGGRQFGFKNTEEQRIEVEWLVTNRLVSACAEGDWRREEVLTFRTPAVGRGEELTSGAHLPLEESVSGALRGAVVHPGEVMLVRWRRERAKNAAALAIDDVRLSFQKRDGTTVVVFR